MPVVSLTQARTRVDQLMKLGHVVDKVEFILMGGTFMSLPSDYRDYFIRNLHDALSGEYPPMVGPVLLDALHQLHSRNTTPCSNSACSLKWGTLLWHPW